MRNQEDSWSKACPDGGKACPDEGKIRVIKKIRGQRREEIRVIKKIRGQRLVLTRERFA